MLDALLRKLPYVRYAWYYRKNAFFRPGHYYSPVIDLEEVRENGDWIWDAEKSLTGIELNTETQREFLPTLFEAAKLIPFSNNPDSKHRYHYDNQSYPHADGMVLFAMLRYCKPAKIIEVGSGFSSALMLDTIDAYLEHRPRLQFIDPNPGVLNGLLRASDAGTAEVLPLPVQRTPLENFLALGKDDILFIDNSHVSKTGSDVNYLMLNILPKLQNGVIVHIHDIFFPFEYPKEWVLEKRLNWNEVYLVQAFLLFNPLFEILFWGDMMVQKFPDEIKQGAPLLFEGRGGSLWLRKKS